MNSYKTDTLLLHTANRKHYHHTRLTALFPGLPGWAGTRKGKPIWILLKQETVSGSGISWDICKSAPRSRPITMPAPHHSVFYQPDALPVIQPTAWKHRRPNRKHYMGLYGLLFCAISNDLWRSFACCITSNAIRRTFVQRFTRFQWTERVARSLGDSWASFLILLHLQCKFAACLLVLSDDVWDEKYALCDTDRYPYYYRHSRLLRTQAMQCFFLSNAMLLFVL